MPPPNRSTPEPTACARETPPPVTASRLGWIAAALVGAVVLAYFPALRGGFVWDDDAHVTAPALRSLSGLWRIWTEPGATQQYYPLLHSAFWLEHRLWGDAVPGYHLVNLALHMIAAGLFALVLRRLAVPGALLAAAIFALHPVHVESVAWISEQKNTLSLVFYLGATLAYLRFDADRRPRHYRLGLVLFALALLTKTVTATLPAALLVVLWWRRSRLSWRGDVLPLVPWFLLGAVAGLFTAWAERKLIGAEGAAFDLTWIQRALLAGRAVWFYLAKLAWPADLIFIYPRWEIAPAVLWQWLPLAGVLSLGAALGWFARRHSRAPLIALLFFVGSLFPVLGFFNVYPFRYSFVADHFQYLPSLGLIALAAAALTDLTAQWPRAVRGTLCLALLGSLGALTWQQSQIFRDRETLYRVTLARNPDCWMAHNNLGLILSERGRRPEAILHFRQALQLKPDYFDGQNNLGLTLTQTGHPTEALPHLQKAVHLKPAAPQAHNNLGIALAACGRTTEAIAAFTDALRLAPGSASIHENLGKALRLAGRDQEAAAHFELAARLRSSAAATRP